MIPLPDVNEIHVWLAELPRLEAQHEELEAVLNAEERARANRMLRASQRGQYTLCRGVLRMLLAAYTGQRPEAVEFAYGPWGKPLAAGQLAEAHLEFNLAHSGELAVYAVTQGRRVGVDVECAREVPEAEQIVARHFAAEECTAWQQLAAEERQAAFFRVWTRREAFAKATGQGLGQGWSEFAVAVEASAARLLHIAGDAAAAAGWTLCDLDLPPPYHGAVAAEGRDLAVRLRAWDAGR
jgi:4'-phosphopantetheinyl transferase